MYACMYVYMYIPKPTSMTRRVRLRTPKSQLEQAQAARASAALAPLGELAEELSEAAVAEAMKLLRVYE